MLSLRVTVVEISLRGSMQISSEDADKQGQSWGSEWQERAKMKNVLYVLEMHKYTQKKIPVSLMEL